MNTITRQEGLAAIGAWWAAEEKRVLSLADKHVIFHPLSDRPGIMAGHFRAAFAPTTEQDLADERHIRNVLTRQLAEHRTEIDMLTQANADLQRRCDTAYTQRNTLVVAFADLAIRLGWKAGWGRDNDENRGWDEEWRTVVYIDLPNGQQLSWHMSPSEQQYAQQLLPKYDGQWDGTFLGRDAPEWVFKVVQLPREKNNAGKIVNWLRINANAEKKPEARAVFIEAHNTALAIMEGRDELPPADPFSDDMLRVAEGGVGGMVKRIIAGTRYTLQDNRDKVAAVTQTGTEYLATLAPLLDKHFDASEGGPAKCDNADQWNCKYCGKTTDCAAVKDERNFGKPIPAQPGITQNDDTLNRYRIWPDGTVQGADERPHSHMSDDYRYVSAADEDAASAMANPPVERDEQVEVEIEQRVARRMEEVAGHQQRHIDELKAKLAGTETLLDEMTKQRDVLQKKAKAFDDLRRLCGYVENGSDQSIRVGQDDAARDWCLRVGPDGKHKLYTASSLEAVLDEAAQYRGVDE